MKSKLRQDLKYKRISDEIKFELSQCGYSDNDVVDILVKFLYGMQKSKNKMALWLCYGDIIFENLQKHIKYQTKQIQCIDCGEWFEINTKDNQTCRCTSCYEEYRRAYYREKKREQRLKNKLSTAQAN
jgi:Zn finger protein HypA/HybF involved in hydrogenase expression